MTKPTQAQIEAGEYDLKCTNGHDRCYMGTSDDCPYCEKVATAAAQVGEPIGSDRWKATIRAATIERCKQVAESLWPIGPGKDYGKALAAALDALKDAP